MTEIPDETERPSEEDLRLIREAAVADPACFVEEVMKDEMTGEPVILAPHQIEWYTHLDRCKAAGKYCGILSPPSSGKSANFAIAYPLWNMGHRPSIRECIVTYAAAQAKKRVRPAKDYVQFDPEFRAIFPRCRPEKPEKWTELEFSVRRPPGIKDPTYFGTGITQPPMGARIDLLIGDDVCTYDNTIAEPAMRQKVIDFWDNGFDTRLGPQSFVVYIGGIIHNKDLTCKLMTDERYWFIMQSVSADFETLVQEDLRTGERKVLPLWPRSWNSDWLRAKHQSNSRAFERAYRHKGYSDEERTFSPAAIRAAIRYVDDAGAVPDGAVSAAGMDMAEKSRAGTVIVTAARLEKRRIVRGVEAGAWNGEEKARRLIAAKQRFRTLVEVVENNALQESVIDLIKVVSEVPLNIESFRTGKQKADEELGIPALAAEFANGMWEIQFPKGHAVGMGCQCGPCRLVGELEEHPFGSTDAVMALWFARHGLEKFGAVPNPEWVSPAPAKLQTFGHDARASRLAAFRQIRRMR